MFSFFKKKPPPSVAPPPPAPAQAPVPAPGAAVPAETPVATASTSAGTTTAAAPSPGLQTPAAEPAPAPRSGWLSRLAQGLRKTGSGIAQVFTGTRIDEALYEDLESALLLADAGLPATQFLLTDLKRRVKESKATDPAAVKALLADALADLLRPLQRPLVIGGADGQASPTVIMVTGVNGAGKTTSIGKLTRYLAEADQKVLLAAADTFRAAAREQLAVWAGRNQVEIVSQEGLSLIHISEPTRPY